MLEAQQMDILNSLGIRFMFETLDLIKECKHVHDVVDKTTQLLNTNVRTQKDAVISYRKENDVRFSKEVEALMERTAKINRDADILKDTLLDIELKLKTVESSLEDGRIHTKKLETERKHLLSEKSKVVESLERVEKGYECALLLYQRYLGISVDKDASDSSKLICTFLPGARKQILPRKVVVSAFNDHFQASDGTVLKSKVHLMDFLLKERKLWLAGK